MNTVVKDGLLVGDLVPVRRVTSDDYKLVGLTAEDITKVPNCMEDGCDAPASHAFFYPAAVQKYVTDESSPTGRWVDGEPCEVIYTLCTQHVAPYLVTPDQIIKRPHQKW